MAKGHILVADDLPDVGWTIKELLEDAGYLVRYAKTRTDALHILGTESFQVAVLDVRMDENDEFNQDGIDLMYEIHKNYPLVKTIIFTGYAVRSIVQEVLSPTLDGTQPAFAFLEKSEFDMLVNVVESAFL